MEPVKIEGLEIRRGTTFTALLRAKNKAKQPIDLTGYKAYMHLREKVTDLAPLIELSTETGEITIEGAAGEIKIVLSAEQTKGLRDGIKSASFDLLLQSPAGEVKMPVFGVIPIHASITRI